MNLLFRVLFASGYTEDHVGAVNLVVRESCGPDLNASKDRVA